MQTNIGRRKGRMGNNGENYKRRNRKNELSKDLSEVVVMERNTVEEPTKLKSFRDYR